MVEILCTMTGILAGVAIVASIMQARGDRGRWQAPTTEVSELQQPEQIKGIADQLRLITYRVAADVTAHNEKVEAINDRLHEPAADQPDHILSAINELITANQQMQSQLADARKRIADQSEMIEEASQQARTDALTGLANRRALNEFLQNCLDAIQPGEYAGLLLLDIDHFKSFNDTYGHTTGDAVLAAFARNIKKFCNQECYPARYGGEEFAVIMTGSEASGLAEKSAALRRFVSEQTIAHEDLQLKITASAGLCVLTQGDTLQSAYDRSDEGLYRAKKAGRNQGFWLNTTHWQPFPDEEESPSTKNRPADAQSLIRQAAMDQHNGRRSRHDDDNYSNNRSGGASADANSSELEGGTVYRKSLGDVLDLSTFMTRTTVYFDQLRRAELPATGMLITPQWNLELDASQSKASWATVLGLVQSQLRGIDVVCIYKAHTACVFLPGCSIEAAGERASRMQMTLESCREQWLPPEHCPDRLSISVAQALNEEEPVDFLERLDSALSEAQDASRFEVVLHDGRSTLFESSLPS
ncbi:MAG: diguanylate cyclase [Pirellulaceae bacterium]|nr:diguanylate cyclase [Pirellulaceae bacterium]